MAKLSSALGAAFDSNAVEPDEGRNFETLPAGVYSAEITNADIKDLKSGNGIGLQLEFTIIDPEAYANRKVWANLNIRHTNPQAEQIGQAQLSALCRSVGIAVLDDSDQLFQKLVRIRVKVRPASGNYKEGNEVVAYEALGDAPAAARTSAQPARTATAAPTPAKATPPWQKRAA